MELYEVTPKGDGNASSVLVPFRGSRPDSRLLAGDLVCARETRELAHARAAAESGRLKPLAKGDAQKHLGALRSYVSVITVLRKLAK